MPKQSSIGKSSPAAVRSYSPPSQSGPMVPFQSYRIRRNTLNGLKAAAAKRAWSTAALVRKILDEWVGKQKQRKEKAR